MEYPGSHLTKKMRTAFLISCIMLFFIITPIIILVATGYRYDWREGFFRENGAVSIDVKPSTATAFLDSVKIQDKMPVRLASITPRKYKVQITNPGYYDWTKEIEVKNKETVYITNLNLIKKSTPKQISKKATVDLAISANGKYLVFSTLHMGGGFDIWMIMTNKNTESLLAYWPGNVSPLLLWSPKDDFLAVSSPVAPYQKILTININNGQKWEVATDNDLSIEKYQWQNTIEPEIYYSTKEYIYSARCLSQKSALIGQNNYLDWIADEGKVWTMNYNSTTQMIDLSADTFGFTRIFASVADSQYRITNRLEWQMYLLKDNTLILKNNTQPKILIVREDAQKIVNGTNAKASEYDNWLFWTPWELNTYKIGEEPYLLIRSENKLQNVLPLDQYNTMALVSETKITALYPYFDVTEDLFSDKVSGATIDSQNKKIYFSINKKTNPGIWSLEY